MYIHNMYGINVLLNYLLCVNDLNKGIYDMNIVKKTYWYIPAINGKQWEFRDPKMERILYCTISPVIGLVGRSLKISSKS